MHTCVTESNMRITSIMPYFYDFFWQVLLRMDKGVTVAFYVAYSGGKFLSNGVSQAVYKHIQRAGNPGFIKFLNYFEKFFF